MAIDEVAGQAWTRKHDDPAMPVVPSASRTVYPRSLEELIELCATRKPSEKLHAAGSHWALSGAAISDDVFVETHDPNNKHQAMGRTLYDVVGVPGCLDKSFIEAIGDLKIPPFATTNVSTPADEGLYPVHIETGKRIYQLYAEMDAGDDDARSLASHLAGGGNRTYTGPWAFKTLGGAGGQTVFGALTTGTHGGDFLLNPATGMRQPPIADSVLAVHLVADGGKHYWIEPELVPSLGVPLTDRALVEDLYGDARYGGPNHSAENFEFIRDDEVFDAVLVGCGRFGIVYSIVIGAVRQYSLHIERRLTTWQAIRGLVNDPTSALYTSKSQPAPVASPNKYLNIVVSVTPSDNFKTNVTGVTKGWNVALAENPLTGEPAGRVERRGARGGIDPQTQARRFKTAGSSSPYQPDPMKPGETIAPDVLSLACTNADFLDGLVEVVATEIDEFVKTNGATVGPAIAAVAAASGAATGGAAFALLLVALAAILPILAALAAVIAALPRPLRLGHVMNLLQRTLLDPSHAPGSPERMGGIFAWQMLALEVFTGQQKAMDAEAISYAALDGKDYLEQSCSVNADSIEVFFDATDPTLVAYIDALLAFEIGLETGAQPAAFVGYLSMRFTGPTRALLGQQRFPMTCSVEISGIRDVVGVTRFVNYATALALNPSFRGILHWGQRNESTRGDVQDRFGDTVGDPTGDLHTWRAALDRLTQHGKLDGFSNAFTRQCGLEVCTPVIGRATAAVSTAGPGAITVDWDCDRNPPTTEVRIDVMSPTGVSSSYGLLPTVGQQEVVATEQGVYSVTLVATIDVAGERREAMQQVSVVMS